MYILKCQLAIETTLKKISIDIHPDETVAYNFVLFRIKLKIQIYHLSLKIKRTKYY